MTGAFLRVKRNGKFENVEVEHLTDEERFDIFIACESDQLIKWINVMCETIAMCETEFKEIQEAFPLYKED